MRRRAVLVAAALCSGAASGSVQAAPERASATTAAVTTAPAGAEAHAGASRRQRPRLPAGVIAPGITIEGIPVSGLTRIPATRKVLTALVVPKLRPIVVTVARRRIAIDPRAAGYSADVAYAVKAALAFGRTRGLVRRVDIPLRESVNSDRVRTIVSRLAARLDVSPVDARLGFANGRPQVRSPRAGSSIVRARARRVVTAALLGPRRPRAHALPRVLVRPAVTSVGRSVVINRSSFTLTLYQGERALRRFGVAVGQPAYPTPAGLFSLIVKQRNPTWFPPSSPWAAGLGPEPPGVNNPLGTRWMGTSAPAIGIHGTPQPWSIGTAASHGCIRMRIPEAEYLYDQIEVGIPVLIV